MKNNKDKLNDAMGMMDENTVQDAMTYADIMKAAAIARASRCALLRRRAAVIVAACLALTLMAGAILAVPLLTADEPAVTDPSATDGPANVTSVPSAKDFYVDAPLVKLAQLSATEVADISDPDNPVEDLGVTMAQSGDMHQYNILTFDCKPGETVTVRAASECLAYIGMPYNADTDVKFGSDFYFSISSCTWGGGPLKPAAGFTLYTDTVMINPEKACIRVELPSGNMNAEENVDDEILTFTVTNEDGQITGAGSIYVKKRNILSENEVSLHVDWFNMTRYSVLGSVRYTNPSAVTEDLVNELQESFTADVEEVEATLDFSPKNEYEKQIYIHTAIIRTEFDGQCISRLGASWGMGDYSCFTAGAGDPEKNQLRSFILFSDGTWAEYLKHDKCSFPSNCHLGCPNEAEYGEHHAWTLGCRFTAIDGRIYELQKVGAEDERGFVLLHDPNA